MSSCSPPARKSSPAPGAASASVRRLLLAADLAPGRKVHVDTVDDRLTFEVSATELAEV